MAKAERGGNPESSTSALNDLRDRRKSRTRRWFFGGLRDIGAGVLLSVGGAIVGGLGAPAVGVGIILLGGAAVIYGAAKTVLGLGNGAFNIASGV